MTDVSGVSPAPVLVLGLGNRLLSDDGLGLELLEELRPGYAGDPRVELVDGGTQGLALLGLLEGRRAVLLLDAVQLGGRPGQVVLSRDPLRTPAPRGAGAHVGNASELLAAARLVGILPPRVVLIGVEVEDLVTGIGLSPAARGGLARARGLAERTLSGLLDDAQAREVETCTS